MSSLAQSELFLVSVVYDFANLVDMFKLFNARLLCRIYHSVIVVFSLILDSTVVQSSCFFVFRLAIQHAPLEAHIICVPDVD